MIPRTIGALSLLLLMFIFGCRHDPEIAVVPSQRKHVAMDEFDIHWPPVDLENQPEKIKRPLLRGSVAVTETVTVTDHRALEITVTITRPSTEADREFWNSQLSFADLPWMDDVRVWDSKSNWQWPNVPFLLRRAGVERIERYGGVDPGKNVDNDFAAVLIRRSDTNEGDRFRSAADLPFVSAEWHANGHQDTHLHSLVHVAKSDTFVVDVGRNAERTAGTLRLWLIYADFLSSRPPASWPKEPEWAGGILTYCEIDYQKPPDQACHAILTFTTPPTSTGFDWEAWSEDQSSPAKSRLTDLQN